MAPGAGSASLKDPIQFHTLEALVGMAKKGWEAVMAKRLAIILLGLLMVGGGCGAGKKVDASSEKAFRQSVQSIADSLNEPRKAEFQEAVATLMFNSVMYEPGEPDAKIKAVFHGKTADQIIADARSVRSQKR